MIRIYYTNASYLYYANIIKKVLDQHNVESTLNHQGELSMYDMIETDPTVYKIIIGYADATDNKVCIRKNGKHVDNIKFSEFSDYIKKHFV